MENALRHALDPDSPYLGPLRHIFTGLPAEDIARCRTLSSFSRRLLCRHEFLRHFPIAFSGFIFTPTPSSNFHYHSLKSGRTFANVPRGPKHFQIFSSHDCMLLTTAYGVRWRIVNPFAGAALIPERRFFRDEFVISATILGEYDYYYKVFFLTTRGYEDAWLVKLQVVRRYGHPSPRISWHRYKLDKSPENRDVRSGRAPKPGVWAVVGDIYYVCVLFPKKPKVWVVSCNSSKNWMLLLLHPDGNAGSGEYCLFRCPEGRVIATRLCVDDLSIWCLDLEGEDPLFRLYQRLQLNTFHGFIPRLRIQFLRLPQAQVEFLAGTLLYLRTERFRMLVYDVATSRVERVIKLCTGEEDGSGDHKWPPVLAYSCLLG